MITKIVTTTVATTVAVVFSTALAFAYPTETTFPTAMDADVSQSYQMAGTVGMDNRDDRRDTRQDCRQGEGAVGDDKRDCKQDGRTG